ncbi:hypothetical protein PHYSODRAFT_331680 [Phytophthora sojae]|uniref:Uncharacterized protein n=1 Tax=Phytophthora sojae (strain P6497) TaxID=1094619 RepID=G4ZJ84_PHYSP|nr:hypothetical protein PHYSODRAFT_331680 [Phytophthora sojae]EGZ17748.1 hypothetical protein PHYSODRAFT_331680 [Phytophthora sojae]|eukprot:XP_009526806.1 hypothetical protein PHYSODRAFT_331680 [Phytophthora sojae]
MNLHAKELPIASKVTAVDHQNIAVLYQLAIASLDFNMVAEEYNTEDIKPIETFTDTGLLALSQLKFLQSLDLRSFYDVVTELLLKIAEASDLPCAERKFVLRLENCSYSSRYAVTPDYGASFLRELERLMMRVKAAHPSLRQHVVTMDRTGNSFMRIAEFGLADPDIYAKWEDWGEDLYFWLSKGLSLSSSSSSKRWAREGV